MSVDAVAALKKENGPIRHALSHLHCVIVIILANANNLGRLAGRQQTARRQLIARAVIAQLFVGRV
ncbi:hypothetical protein SDC9_193837 [bioreactor metagenome]|uniref:Uncharacterized protein n=1 Tax=bioreactor metagenome TaxID=1076179 RepID=A0A645ID82_9ZZZZ